MTRIRGVLLVVLLGVLGIWYASGDERPSRPAPLVPPGRKAVRAAALPREFVFEAGAAALRDSAAHAAVPRSPARNPFAFAQPVAPAVVFPSRPGIAPARPALIESAVAPAPAIRFVGLIEADRDDDATRVAVLATRSELFLVRAGDQVAGRYTVVRVGVDHVELREADGRASRLALSPR